MPLYEYEDIPGVDILQDKTDEFLTVKQCVSVAHQMGKKNVISETYGVTVDAPGASVTYHALNI